MRRPIIRPNNNLQIDLETHLSKRATVELQPAMVEKRLRQKRSSSYVEAVTKLDVTGVHCHQDEVVRMIQELKKEFPELMEHQLPIGIVSKCYLGEPYEVHTLDTQLQIVEHYKRGSVLPNGMEKARILAINPNYEFVEVFTSYVCAVSTSGQISMIKG